MRGRQGGGWPQSRCRLISDLRLQRSPVWLSPSRTLPRKTGEGHEVSAQRSRLLQHCDLGGAKARLAQDFVAMLADGGGWAWRAPVGEAPAGGGVCPAPVLG